MISEEQQLSRLDTAFARFLGERTTFDPIQKQAFENLVMSVSYEQCQGHSCILLDDEGKALILASGLAVSHSQARAKEPAA
ncbi:MAG: hypothetical protein PHD43_11470 [Methylococcales bacterium]|nr:hypothetical protein [Methylococcales bacterium]